MQLKTLCRGLVMKLEDVTQANEEIDAAVHRSASAYRGTKRVVVSRTSSHEDGNVG